MPDNLNEFLFQAGQIRNAVNRGTLPVAVLGWEQSFLNNKLTYQEFEEYADLCEEVISDLVEENDSLQRDVKDLSALEMERNFLEDAISDLADELDVADEVIDDFADQIIGLENAVEDLTNDLTGLEWDFDDLNKRHSDLVGQTLLKDEKLHNQRIQLADLQWKINAMKSFGGIFRTFCQKFGVWK